MCFKQNRKFKSKHLEHDYSNKRTKNINIIKIYQANVNVNSKMQKVNRIKME